MKLTRSEVVSRGETAFPLCGYIFGGYFGDRTRCHINDKGYGVSGSGEYIATDCSGFTSWAWGLGYHAHSSAWGPSGIYGRQGYHKRSSYTGNISTDFLGIRRGDVIHKEGHVILYIGAGETLEASTQHWSNTSTGRGMVHRTSAQGSWTGYTSYSESYSEDYDPELTPDINDWSPESSITPGPPIPPYMDDEELYMMAAVLDNQYTKRYARLKAWRKADK